MYFCHCLRPHSYSAVVLFFYTMLKHPDTPSETKLRPPPLPCFILVLCDMNTWLSQRSLDNRMTLRTLPGFPLGNYYEQREAYLSPCFTPPRAHARGAHHLPLRDHGDKPAYALGSSECTTPSRHRPGNLTPRWSTVDGRAASGWAFCPLDLAIALFEHSLRNDISRGCRDAIIRLPRYAYQTVVLE